MFRYHKDNVIIVGDLTRTEYLLARIATLEYVTSVMLSGLENIMRFEKDAFLN